mmetsp:Transcript_33376/g.82691  ORF Transcript_33376/g.82691 Transcript_33376/m.82691 type:complete len:257 (-) Transcript_33376:44-814(-)
MAGGEGCGRGLRSQGQLQCGCQRQHVPGQVGVQLQRPRRTDCYVWDGRHTRQQTGKEHHRQSRRSPSPDGRVRRRRALRRPGGQGVHERHHGWLPESGQLRDAQDGRQQKSLHLRRCGQARAAAVGQGRDGQPRPVQGQSRHQRRLPSRPSHLQRHHHPLPLRPFRHQRHTRRLDGLLPRHQLTRQLPTPSHNRPRQHFHTRRGRHHSDGQGGGRGRRGQQGAGRSLHGQRHDRAALRVAEGGIEGRERRGHGGGD